jgi:hypothetical protein
MRSAALLLFLELLQPEVETQRRAAGKASGIDGTIRMKWGLARNLPSALHQYSQSMRSLPSFQ